MVCIINLFTNHILSQINLILSFLIVILLNIILELKKLLCFKNYYFQENSLIKLNFHNFFEIINANQKSLIFPILLFYEFIHNLLCHKFLLL